MRGSSIVESVTHYLTHSRPEASGNRRTNRGRERYGFSQRQRGGQAAWAGSRQHEGRSGTLAHFVSEGSEPLKILSNGAERWTTDGERRGQNGL